MSSASPSSASVEPQIERTPGEGSPPAPPRLGGRPRLVAALRNSLGLRRATLDFFARNSTVADFIEVPIVAGRTVYFVNSPSGIRRVLVDNVDGYSRRDNLEVPMFRDAVGEGLLATDGELWVRLRRLHARPFGERQVAGLARGIADHCARILSTWTAFRPANAYVDLFPRLISLTAAISVKCLFDYDLSESSALSLSRALMIGQDHVFAELLAAVRTPPWFPSPLNLRYRRGLEVVEDTFRRILEERSRQPEAPREDLLSGLLAFRDPATGRPLDDRALRDQIVTALVAAPENMATALSWSLHELAGREDLVAGFLAADVDGAPVAPGEGYPTRFLREVLRLYPGAPVITRRALTDDLVDGYRVPKDGLVVISPYVLHRDPRFWSRPETFDVDRPEYAKFSSGDARLHYMPFGAGPRRCVGDHFSRVVLGVVLTMLVRRLEVEADPRRPAFPAPRVNLRPVDGLWMRLRERDAPR